MSRQIVITLPEWTEIKGIDNKQFAELLPCYDEMLNMIKNGTPLDEVLDKIRDEMQKEKENIHFDLNEQKAKWVNSGIYDGLTWAQDIIDKYREEQE